MGPPGGSADTLPHPREPTDTRSPSGWKIMRSAPRVVRIERTLGERYVWCQAVVMWPGSWTTRGDRLQGITAELVLDRVPPPDSNRMVFARMPEPEDIVTLVPGVERTIPLVVRALFDGAVGYSTDRIFPVQAGTTRITTLSTIICGGPHLDLAPAMEHNAALELQCDGEVIAKPRMTICAPPVDDPTNDGFDVWLER